MSLKLGNIPIAGISQNTKYNAHHLLDFKWTDCIMNDVSWLRADTFSWQSGGVYVTVYNHLVQDIQGITAETETIGSYTVTFYRATDGHKICLADQETTIANIYSETGIAWYYILDTVNTQFKLPRTKYGFEGLRTNVGDKIDAGLPDISHNHIQGFAGVNANASYGVATAPADNINLQSGTNTLYHPYTSTDTLSSHNPIYGNSTTVQEQATQMYLYFYVGDYSQTAIEQTAGLNAELFNGKADTNLNNVPASKGILTESYVNGASGYRVYSDGYCEQWGIASGQSSAVTFLKAYKQTDNALNVTVTPLNTAADSNTRFPVVIYNISNTGFTSYAVIANLIGCYWKSCGYIS